MNGGAFVTRVAAVLAMPVIGRRATNRTPGRTVNRALRLGAWVFVVGRPARSEWTCSVHGAFVSGGLRSRPRHAPGLSSSALHLGFITNICGARREPAGQTNKWKAHLGNQLIAPQGDQNGGAHVRCRERLGGLLRYYEYAA